MNVDRNPPEPAANQRPTLDAAADAARAQLARVMAQFPGAVAVYSGPQHVFRAVSAAFRSFIGGREVVGLPIREALPELDGQGFFEQLDQVYVTGTAVMVTDVPARWDSDGDGEAEAHRIDFMCQPLITADGGVEGIVAFVQDVTARHTALAALAASEARYRLAVDAAQLGTWAWDIATDVATFDERVRELLGLGRDHTRSRAGIIETRVHPDDRDRLNAALTRAIDPAGDGRFQGEYRVVHEDGTERWALAFGRMHFAGASDATSAAQLIGTVLDITERKYAEARQRVLARVGGDLLLAADENVALQRLVDAAVGDLADWAIVDVIEPDRRTARRAAMAHADAAMLDVMREMTTRYPPDPSQPTLGRDALATGQAQLYADISEPLLAAVSRDARQAEMARQIGIRSAIAVPLQTREGPFGIAAFGSGRRTFAGEDVAVAEELARRASLAVENARLVAAARRAQDDAERAASRIARLQTLSAALASALTPNDVAATAVREGVAAIGADAGVLVLATPEGDQLDVVESLGYDPRQIERWRRFPLAVQAPLSDAIRSGEVVVVVSLEDRAARYPALGNDPPVTYQASISVPLVAEGRSFGALGLSFREPIVVRPEDRELLLAVARQCAQAVRRATLFDAEAVARASAEAAGRRLAFLADASAALSSLDYEATLQRVAQLAVPAFADYVAIDLLDAHGAMLRVATAHADPVKAEVLRNTSQYYPTASDSASHPLRQAIARGEPVLTADIDEAWMQRATRSPAHLADVRYLNPRSFIMAPLVARGNTLGVIAFAVSDSGRRYAEADLALAAEVARRAAAAVDNAQLYRESESARRDAEGASRAKGQFLAVMSHELRTPLNAILGYSELVEMGVHGPVTDAQREAMTRVRRSGQHLLALVNNVLNLERSEIGGLETELVPIQVAQLFEDAEMLTRPQAEAKGITLTVMKPRAELRVLGEQDKAGQVLVNLLSNAVKFTRADGTITLSVALEADMVALRVTDTGVGIPGEALERIFEPFVQLDSGLTRAAEGAGLGLAISRRLARLMGGELTASSEVGVGSTFVFSLVGVPESSA
ncbi:MAG TPA: GAF domain-containing protein [Gemmatimonadaceae bacterium]|nr:GAF domain-containing protein [Gemmatimonadaceae bacterium]